MHKYQLIEEYIKTNIEDGTFKRGESIYPEIKLANMFKVLPLLSLILVLILSRQ
ncbi:hypothetical protein GOQ29_13955 [Clostridium sp. D2Q-14]|uniref:hypothetical protein n=1 Tax=Anaeromonas gelatinilytica TaxID=2683194 RepID=UPI00193B345C|nr:hypothetical protein [Anaeromonas gelatinilytica]MBS4536723.1 hypothetical protein [Anaeromonas gelatinilytica]